MRKISTLFKKDPQDLGRVINEVNPENQWVIDGEGIPTRKYDGTASAIINGTLYKRYDVKKGRQVPDGAIPCQEADLITGHHPHWLKCDINKSEDKYFFEAFDLLIERGWRIDGTYELIGEKIQGNPEKIKGHQLVRHGMTTITDINPISFENIKEYLRTEDIEGIVFYHKIDGRMCKIRKKDFGFKRNGDVYKRSRDYIQELELAFNKSFRNDRNSKAIVVPIRFYIGLFDQLIHLGSHHFREDGVVLFGCRVLSSNQVNKIEF